MEIRDTNPFLFRGPSRPPLGDATKRQIIKAFFDHSPMLMGVVAYDGERVLHKAANRLAIELFREAGGEFQDAGGVPMTALGFTREEVERWEDHLAESAASGEAVHFETVFPWGGERGGDGVRELEVTVVPTQTEAAAGRLFAYVSEDVTDRRAADRDRHLLAAAVEQAAESIIVTGPELDRPGPEILYVNRAHERLFGYARDELRGTTPRQFQGPETDRAELDRVRAALEAGEPVESETVNYRKDGTPFLLRWDLAPVRNDANEVTHWVGTQRDVTERRWLEREVLDIAARERARMARELHDGIGQVLFGVSLKLQSVREALAARGDDALAGQLDEVVDDMAGAQRQARAVAHGLFPVEVAGDGLMEALGALCLEADRAYGVDCTFEFDAPVVMASVEAAEHVYRIVQEALANAVRHAEAGAVAVTFSHEAPDRVVLSVRDDGVGIGDEARTGGGGIGLRTMRLRANQIGGAFDVRAPVAGGTAVVVRFDPGRIGSRPPA